MAAAPLIAALLAGFALLTAGLWRWTRPTPSRGGHQCGRCGYDVRGLPTPTCPECGADLRVVGTVDPSRRAWKSRWTFIFAWTLLILVASLAAIPPLMDRVGFARRTASNTLAWRAGSNVKDSDTLELTCTAQNTELYWRGSDNHRRLLYQDSYRIDIPNGADAHLQVDSQRRTATLINGTRQPLGPSQPFDRSALTALAATNDRVMDKALAAPAFDLLDDFVVHTAGVTMPYNSTAGTVTSGSRTLKQSASAGVSYRWNTADTVSDSLSPMNHFIWLAPLALWWLGLRLDRRRRMPESVPK